MQGKEHKPSDSPARFRAKVLRVDSQGNKRPVPVVAQATFEGGVDFEANSLGRLKHVGGVEAAQIQASLSGSIEPKVAENARRQHLAIDNYYAKKAR